MVSASGLGLKYMFQKQAIASSEQAPPVQNTWYTILDTEEDVRLIYLTLIQDNDENAAKDVEFRVTIDGITLLAQYSAADNTLYTHYLQHYQDGLASTTGTQNTGNYIDIRGQSVKVEMRITAALGTNQTLKGYVQYEELLET